jgi:hypothetical protein
MATNWVITFTFDVDPSTETDEWESKVEAFDGSVARIPGRGVEVTVHTSGAHSFDALNKSAIEVGRLLELGPPAGVEVVTEGEHGRRAEAPTMPELMSAAEIAEELGVRRQRVHQLRSTAAFPAPLAELRGGAVWDAAAVRKFAKGRERKPGRPRGTAQEHPDLSNRDHGTDLSVAVDTRRGAEFAAALSRTMQTAELLEYDAMRNATR